MRGPRPLASGPDPRVLACESVSPRRSTRLSPPRSLRPRDLAKAVLLGFALTAVAFGCTSGTDAPDASTSTTDDTLAYAPVPEGCNEELREDPTVPPEIGLLVADFAATAELPEATPYEHYDERCDNTGVTSIEAPTRFDDVEPAPGAPPQTAVRLSTDFSAPIESEPVINFFAAPVGGDQFPTLPRLAALVGRSADGSLSSGTRDPRQGTTISEDCRALPPQDIETGRFTGAIQFFVDCGGDHRAWALVAAAPDDDDPYFVQLIAHVLTTADAEAFGRALASMSVDAENLETFTEVQEAEQQRAAASATSSPTASTARDTSTTTDAP